MTQLAELLLESWDRQAQIIRNTAALVTEANRHARPSEDGMPLDMQLAHIHQTRKFWLGMINEEYRQDLGRAVNVLDDDTWVPLDDLDEIKRQVDASAARVRQVVADSLENPPAKSPYDHPAFFLQHMIWHEGYHFALIMLGLRNVGIDPGEAWEEPNVWGLWRTEEFD